MGKFLKPGKVVIILAGRHAGKKGVIVKSYDDGTGARRFGHCIVAGVDRPPRKVTKAMSKAKIKKRTKIKPFVKFVNHSHIMPTRYAVDLDVKKIVDIRSYVDEPANRGEIRKALKQHFEQRYTSQTEIRSDKTRQGVNYFFTKLRF